MMRTHSQARAGNRFAILAALGLTAALLYLLFIELNTAPGVPVYAASPLSPPNLLAPASGAVISDTTPTLSWAASPPLAIGYYLKVDGWTRDVGPATSGEASPLADGVHTWTVSAYDDAHNESDDAPERSFTVDASAPPAPVLQSPSSETATSDTSLMLQWAASDGATGYRLSWNGAVSDVGSTTWHILNDLADDTYSWSVAAYDSVGNVSAYPAAWTVRVDTTPPAPPALTSPADGETIVDPTPMLRWGASAEATGYWLKLDGDEVDVGNATSRTAPLLTAGAHTWSVAAYDQLGNRSTYGDSWSFTLEIVDPVPPVLVYPANGTVISDTTPTLEWEEAPGAVNYWLRWDESLPRQVGDRLVYAVSASESTHSWSIASVNAEGAVSSYSEPYTFTVDITPPPAPALASPASGSILSTSTPLLSWHAVADAVSYKLRWDETTIDVGDTISYGVSTADGPHTWTVAAYDHVGNLSAYAGTRSLTVDTTPPTVEMTVPADGAIEVPPKASLEIRFSEPIKAATLEVAVSPDPGDWLAAWSPGNQAVTLSHAAFGGETVYVVTVIAADDVAGLAMGASYSWTFETERYLLYLPIVLRTH